MPVAARRRQRFTGSRSPRRLWPVAVLPPAVALCPREGNGTKRRLRAYDRSMSDEKSEAPRKPIRLWPGVAIVVVQWVLRFVAPALMPDAIIVGIFAGLIGWLAIIIWWSFFSRAPRYERLAAIV